MRDCNKTRQMTYIYTTNDKTMKALEKKTPAKAIFTITLGEGKSKVMEVMPSYGFQIKETRKAKNLNDLNKIIGENGFTLKEVRPLVNYLELTNEKFAELTGVSSRTISRWEDETTIGVMASKTLVEMDKLTQKGVRIFGDDESFIEWLNQSNTALGNSSPLQMLSKPYGMEMVEDALEALEYGNVM
jgi:putative toxin-antitoxin system antitoxin component (TIGR02293 family)